jgi:hypothetical protein
MAHLIDEQGDGTNNQDEKVLARRVGGVPGFQDEPYS